MDSFFFFLLEEFDEERSVVWIPTSISCWVLTCFGFRPLFKGVVNGDIREREETESKSTYLHYPKEFQRHQESYSPYQPPYPNQAPQKG